MNPQSEIAGFFGFKNGVRFNGQVIDYLGIIDKGVSRFKQRRNGLCQNCISHWQDVITTGAQTS